MFEAPDFRRKRDISSKYKILFLLVCIIGVLLHSYCSNKTVNSLKVDEQTIMFDEINMQSAIVNFSIENQSNREITQKTRIEIFDQDKNLITSTIKYYDYKPGRNIFKERIKFSNRVSDIDSRQLNAKITVLVRKVLW